jgi:hypothetical protein
LEGDGRSLLQATIPNPRGDNERKLIGIPDNPTETRSGSFPNISYSYIGIHVRYDEFERMLTGASMGYFKMLFKNLHGGN